MDAITIEEQQLLSWVFYPGSYTKCPTGKLASFSIIMLQGSNDGHLASGLLGFLKLFCSMLGDIS